MGIFYQLVHLFRRGGNLSIPLRALRLNAPVARRLLGVASVGMLQFLIGTASWLGILRILADFGGTAVAAYTISVRIIVFTLLPSWGLGNAAATLVGQNLGAGKPDRAERAVWMSGAVNAVFLSSVALMFWIFPETLIRISSDLPEVVGLASDCLRTVSLSYVFLAFGMVTVQAFNGAGDTTTPIWINLFCYWFLQIPVAYVLAIRMGYGPQGVFASIAISQATLAVVSVRFFRKGHWKTRNL